MSAFLTEHYQEALVKGGEKYDLKYNAGKDKKTKRKSKNILYFTPPFCLSVETKTSKRFLEIVSRNFGPMHLYYKIYSRKLLKILYSCMPKHEEPDIVL